MGTPEPIEEKELSEKAASVGDADSLASDKGKQPVIEKANVPDREAFLLWRALYELRWSEQEASIATMDEKIAARKRALIEYEETRARGGRPQDEGFRHFKQPAPQRGKSPPEPATKKSKR